MVVESSEMDDCHSHYADAELAADVLRESWAGHEVDCMTWNWMQSCAGPEYEEISMDETESTTVIQNHCSRPLLDAGFRLWLTCCGVQSR